MNYKCCTGGSAAASKVNNCPGTCRLALDTSNGCNSNEDVNMSYTCGANTNMKCCITKSSAAATSAPYTSASGSGGGGASLTFPPPTSHKTFQSLLTAVAVALKNLVVVAAILFIVVGGLMYVISSGNETMMKRARACITGALIGLAIVVAGPSFLKEIQTILGTSVSSELSSQPSIATIGARILSFILSIFGIIAIIFLVWGGTNYLTAYGNEKKIQEAKSMVTYSIIGIVIALSALVVVQQVIDLLS
jgi:TRAP-type C4-dicarboxylate transport system permease small subunit